jgi:hypothetical protein
LGANDEKTLVFGHVSESRSNSRHEAHALDSSSDNWRETKCKLASKVKYEVRLFEGRQHCGMRRRIGEESCIGAGRQTALMTRSMQTASEELSVSDPYTKVRMSPS